MSRTPMFLAPSLFRPFGRSREADGHAGQGGRLRRTVTDFPALTGIGDDLGRTYRCP